MVRLLDIICVFNVFEKPVDRPVVPEESSTALCSICLFTLILSVILHSRGPVHKTSKGYQVEGKGEHVDHEEVVGGQALQVDEGLCQGMGQQALSAKLQECCQDLAFRCGPVL